MAPTKDERERLAKVMAFKWWGKNTKKDDRDFDSIRTLILNPPSDPKPSVTMREIKECQERGQMNMIWLVRLLRSRGIEVIE